MSNASYGDCNGEYKYVPFRVTWAPDKPVYQRVDKNRYIYWSEFNGLQWAIMHKAYSGYLQGSVFFSTEGYYQQSKYR